MIELFLIRNKTMYEVPVISVKWTGSTNKAYRQIDVAYMFSKKGGHKGMQAAEGDGVIFRWKGKELFRGSIFTIGGNKSGMKSFTAYDLLVYAVKNRDSYLFKQQSLSDIFRRTCNDFGIPLGSVANTGYIFSHKVFDGETLYDIWMKGLADTRKQTKKKYRIYADKGNVHLVERKDQVIQWVIEEGSNLLDYQYSRSIEDTITQVKLESGEEKNTLRATLSNDSGIEKYGVLQHYEKVSDSLNKGELEERGRAILEENGKVQRTLDLSALGSVEFLTGKAVYLLSKELEVSSSFYITSDTHTFQGNSHIVDLAVSETEDLPKVG